VKDSLFDFDLGRAHGPKEMKFKNVGG